MEETNKPTEETQVHDSTTVSQADVNIDELFGMPGADSVMLPENEESEKPKSVFSKNTVDMTFFDKTDNKEDTPEKKIEVEEAINELNELITQEEETGNKGRPKVDKSGLSELAQKMIEEGSLIPFDDEIILYLHTLTNNYSFQ